MYRPQSLIHVPVLLVLSRALLKESAMNTAMNVHKGYGGGIANCSQGRADSGRASWHTCALHQSLIR